MYINKLYCCASVMTGCSDSGQAGGDAGLSYQTLARQVTLARDTIIVGY